MCGPISYVRREHRHSKGEGKNEEIDDCNTRPVVADRSRNRFVRPGQEGRYEERAQEEEGKEGQERREAKLTLSSFLILRVAAWRCVFLSAARQSFFFRNKLTHPL